MLDLPELLDKVLQRLRRHDLSQCAQVNKQWHALTIPHLWRDLTCIELEGRIAFRRIVLEDYLQENGCEEGPPQPSALSKYGHLIRLLPSPRDLEKTLRSEACTQQGNEPTTHVLLQQLFKRSFEAQVEFLNYQFKDPESDEMKSILAFTLPRLRSLFIQGFLQGTQTEFIKFKSALNQCPTTLEKLYVNAHIKCAVETVGMQDEATEDESICWTSLKELTLRHIPDTWDAGLLWSWMWKRCSQVNHLKVKKIDKTTPSLVQAMLAHMPNLQTISMGEISLPYIPGLRDDVAAALLSGSRHGWKSVSIEDRVHLGPKAMNTLAMHYSTLESLHIDGYNDLLNHGLVQVLRSCPHLHTLWCMDVFNKSSIVYGARNSMVDGSTFVDLDPDTGLHRPWLCERSLKSLTIRIDGIPRPDLEEEGTLNVKEHPSRGREIQRQVCARLGKLANLEILRLNADYGTSHSNSLEMSLESGLDKLSGLKSLKELNVRRMPTKIGIKEAQWMVENWPKLSVIRGPFEERRDVEAVEWLEKNCPGIKLL